jgi:hypothetical protein
MAADGDDNAKVRNGSRTKQKGRQIALPPP